MLFFFFFTFYLWGYDGLCMLETLKGDTACKLLAIYFNTYFSYGNDVKLPVRTDTRVWLLIRNLSRGDSFGCSKKVCAGLELPPWVLPWGLCALTPVAGFSPCSCVLWMASRACWLKRLSHMLHTCTASLFFQMVDDIAANTRGEAEGWGMPGLRDLWVSLLCDEGRGDLDAISWDNICASASSLITRLAKAGDVEAWSVAVLISTSPWSVCMCWSNRYSIWKACSHIGQRNGLLCVVRWHCNSISLVKLSAQNRHR